MNDFTKEELEWLYDEIDAVIEQYEYEDYRAYSTRDKLKSLIDNYCEHSYYLQGCGEQVFAQCHKCGQVSKVEAK